MKRYKHSLSNYKLLTCDPGYLVPIGCIDVLPGDTFRFETSLLARVSPLLAPIMHPVTVRIHHWFVPMRLLEDGWEDFITGENATGPDTAALTTRNPSGLWDYLGIPTGVSGSTTVNLYPLKAYNLVFNEFYRDEDLIAPYALTNSSLKRVAWGKDRFTAARPWPQKGLSDITIPLGSTAPVLADANAVSEAVSTTAGADSQLVTATGGANIYADLQNAVGADVRDVRLAFAMQRYDEARAIYGSRYSEYLRYIGVQPKDARLQRPEYLGGGRRTISFSEVLQTAEGTDPVGDMKGHGIAAVGSRRFIKFFEEHGVVMSLMSVVPKTIYANGLHKKYLKSTKEDYYQKELEFVGQQEVYNNEVYMVDDAAGTGDDIFGYEDRYAEYKEEPSTIHGDFRNTLDFWHLARMFTSAPALNQSFVECNPSDRIYASTATDKLWCLASHSIQARRMVRKSSVGRII